jgi:hypothetical protein
MWPNSLNIETTYATLDGRGSAYPNFFVNRLISVTQMKLVVSRTQQM